MSDCPFWGKPPAVGKAPLCSPAIHEVLLCLSFTHEEGFIALFASFVQRCVLLSLEGGWQRNLTSVRQKLSPWGFLEDASLTALKSDDGAITLLQQVFTISGFCGMRMESLVAKKVRPDRMPFLLPTEFRNKAFKTRTLLQTEAFSCVSSQVRNTCPEKGLYMGPFTWQNICLQLRLCLLLYKILEETIIGSLQ